MAFTIIGVEEEKSNDGTEKKRKRNNGEQFIHFLLIGDLIKVLGENGNGNGGVLYEVDDGRKSRIVHVEYCYTLHL